MIACFLCTEKKDELDQLDQYLIYSTPNRELSICTECTEEIEELLKDPSVDWNRRIGKCSICRTEIHIMQYQADPKGVFVDLYSRKKSNFYRICKSCFDRNIDI